MGYDRISGININNESRSKEAASVWLDRISMPTHARVQAHPTASKLVDAAGNTLTTTSTQLQQKPIEEGIMELPPSSREIRFPAELVNIPNVTHANIKRHANQHSRARTTEQETPYRKQKSPEHHTERSLRTLKKIFQHPTYTPP